MSSESCGKLEEAYVISITPCESNTIQVARGQSGSIPLRNGENDITRSDGISVSGKEIYSEEVRCLLDENLGFINAINIVRVF